MMSKQNAKKDYIKTPIAVLDYIKELEDIISELYEDNSYWWQEVGEELADKVERAAKQI